MGQLLQHAPQCGDAHLRALVGVVVIAVVVYPESLPFRYPATGVRPQHQSVVSCRESLCHIPQRVQHGERVGAVQVFGVLAPQPDAVPLAHVRDGGQSSPVRVEQQVAVLGNLRGTLCHLQRVIKREAGKAVLRHHVYDDRALCLLLGIGQAVVSFPAGHAAEHTYIYYNECKIFLHNCKGTIMRPIRGVKSFQLEKIFFLVGFLIFPSWGNFAKPFRFCHTHK